MDFGNTSEEAQGAVDSIYADSPDNQASATNEATSSDHNPLQDLSFTPADEPNEQDTKELSATAAPIVEPIEPAKAQQEVPLDSKDDSPNSTEVNLPETVIESSNSEVDDSVSFQIGSLDEVEEREDKSAHPVTEEPATSFSGRAPNDPREIRRRQQKQKKTSEE